MNLFLLAFLVSTAASHISSRFLRCELHRTYGQCSAAKSCAWCSSSALSGGCYHKSFAKSLARVESKCVGTEELGETHSPMTLSKQQHSFQIHAAAVLAGERVSGPSSASHFSRPDGKKRPVYESVPRVGRRTLGTLLGAGVLGLPVGRSSATPSIDSVDPATDIKLVTFDGAQGTTRAWRGVAIPDYRLGFSEKTRIKTAVSDGVLVLDGKVLPFLFGYGQVIAETADQDFPDVSSCEGISFVVKSTTPFEGYHFSFGKAQAPDASPFIFGYKARFDAPRDEFAAVRIPFKAFTNLWDESTGDPNKTCKEFPRYCPDQETLKNMQTVSFWGEGSPGELHLEVKEISAYGCGEKGTKETRISLTILDEGRSTSLSWRIGVISFGFASLLAARLWFKPRPVYLALLG